MPPLGDRIDLEHVAIVLVRPRFPENIGAAARAMKNMGIETLLVVSPENFDRERIDRMATHAARDIVDRAAIHSLLSDALSSFSYVVGTTARLGGERCNVLTPKTLTQKLLPISRKNRIALLFGSEDRGLLNEELRLCHDLVCIPTADFSSLNLAQAVMVLCYELHEAHRMEKTSPVPRLATRHELDGMYDQLRDVLVRIHYINPEHPDYWMNKVRRFFNRHQLRAGEVSVIRGICRQILWYGSRPRDRMDDPNG